VWRRRVHAPESPQPAEEEPPCPIEKVTKPIKQNVPNWSTCHPNGPDPERFKRDPAIRPTTAHGITSRAPPHVSDAYYLPDDAGHVNHSLDTRLRVGAAAPHTLVSLPPQKQRGEGSIWEHHFPFSRARHSLFVATPGASTGRVTRGSHPPLRTCCSASTTCAAYGGGGRLWCCGLELPPVFGAEILTKSPSTPAIEHGFLSLVKKVISWVKISFER
jgi:hypothetical protein